MIQPRATALLGSQRAVVALEALPRFEAQARGRQVGSLKRGDSVPVRQTFDERGGRSDDQAAELFQTNRQYVSDAKRLAAEIRLRAERRIGELLGPGDEVKTGPGRNASLTYEALLSKDERYDARQLAGIPRPEFEDRINEGKAACVVMPAESLPRRAAIFGTFRLDGGHDDGRDH